jgi:DNA-binding XRE family transcriptional regulator
MSCFSLLAQQVGVSFQTVQVWEAGKYQPRLRHLKRLCEVLEATPAELLGEETADAKQAA